MNNFTLDILFGQDTGDNDFLINELISRLQIN